MSAPGSKNIFAWRPPAARRKSMSDFHAVHVDPIFSPVLVIIASQHQHDFLALCILRQFKSVTKPAVTIVFDFIGRLVLATLQTLFRSRGHGSLVCTTNETPPGNIDPMP